MLSKLVLSSNQARGIAVSENGPDVAGPRAGRTSMTGYESDSDNGDVECPTCGKDGLQSVGGMKTHHKLVHGESIAGSEVECSWCGESKRQRAGRETQKYHFCDHGCQAKWLSANNTGNDNPCWKPLVGVECSWCGGSMEVYPYKARQQDNFFCGGPCQADWNRSLPKEEQPAWNGGVLTVYGEGWSKRKRESIRSRQDHRCAGCGVHESDLSLNMDVHHIQKARSFDNAKERNHPDNLVALCRACHSHWEKISPLRPQTPYLD